MSSVIWIFLIGIIILCFIIYILRLRHQYTTLQSTHTAIWDDSETLNNSVVRLKKENDVLKKIVVADENIFNFIRCINVPQAPSCLTKMNDNGDSTIPDEPAHVCRSRQIDCNKYKLLFESDPIMRERIHLATDLYTQSDKEKNPSDLTYPARSGWYY
jgi:hypothetical protein